MRAGNSRSKSGPHLLVLGSSATALAVVRAVGRLGGTATVVDSETGSAVRSRYCSRFVRVPNHDAPNTTSETLTLLQRASDVAPCSHLIATSDRWLAFLIHQRTALESSLSILHADNSVLAMCLDKRLFYIMCAERELPIPRTVESIATPEELDSQHLFFDPPYIVRLAKNRWTGEAMFPKTMRINSVAELTKLCVEAHQRGFIEDLLITESLLTRRLAQYSIPICRTPTMLFCYAAEKVRPAPDACAVGSYVKLVERPDLVQLGCRVAETIGYYGIGELEVLEDRNTRELFIIELNPRPWTQFNLQYHAGVDFLGALLGSAGTLPHHSARAAWLSLYEDNYYLRSRMPITNASIQSLSALANARTWCYFHPRDPVPAFYELGRILRSHFRHRQ